MKNSIHSLRKNPLISGSIIIFSASVLSNVLSYVYHLFLGRSLGPEKYGEFSSLNSLIYLLMVATTVIATSLTKYFSKCKAQSTPEQAHDLYIRSTARLKHYLLIGFFVAIVVSYPVSLYLHLSSWLSIPMIYGIFCLFTLISVNSSVFSGFQKFELTALFGTLIILLRFLFALPAARFGVFSTVTSYFIANVITYIITSSVVRSLFTSGKKRFDITVKEMFVGNIQTFIILLAMTSLYSTDIVLVRNLFTSKESGWYAGVAVLGKIIFYASSAIGQVVLPVVAERSYSGKKSFRMMGLAIGLVGIISIVCLCIFAFFPTLVIHLLFGPSYDPAVSFLFPFGIFMVMYSIINIIAMGLIGSSKTGIWKIFAIAALAQAIGIYLFHTTIGSVILVNNVVVGLLLVGVLLYFFQAERPGKHAETP